MKTIKIMAALLLLCVVVSCSKDDDDSGSASTSAGVIDKKTGLRIKSCGNYNIYYNDDGRLNYIDDGYRKWMFSYKPDKITEKGGDEGILNVGYNGSGYLSSVKFSDVDTEGRWNENESSTLSYDGSGHLINISGSGHEIGTENGKRYDESWTFSYTFTWRNNLLQQMVYIEKDVEDGETETYTEKWIFSYDNDSYENVYRQWTPSLVEYLENFEELLAVVGLLGVGPNMLPSSADVTEEEYYDGKSHTYNNSYTFRYGFNSNGSISYTTANGTRCNFSYDYAESDDRSSNLNKKIGPIPFVQEREPAKFSHHIFRKHRDK